jgi:hypothetical protein
MVDHVIRTEINRVNARRQRRGPSTHPTVEGIDTALLDLTPHRDYPVPLGALGVDGVGWQILPRPLVADKGLPRGGALSTRDEGHTWGRCDEFIPTIPPKRIRQMHHLFIPPWKIV